MSNAVNNKVQPAIKSYFFGAGYQELFDTIREAWLLNFESIGDAKSNMGDRWHGESGIFRKWIPLIFNLAKLIAIFIFGSIFTIGASIVHIAVLFFFFALVYAGFSIVWLIDRIYILTHRISSACPNNNCQEKFLLPMYVCECGREHTHLVPGKYGILKRRCLCGRKLPTTFLNGREKIQGLCPYCGTKIGSGGKSMMISIPVIGGPSVGKSIFINMSIHRIKDAIAPSKGWNFDFYDADDERRFNEAYTMLSKGQRINKTSEENLTAFKYNLTAPQWDIARTVYIYDIAGEAFASSEGILSQKRYSYSNGFVFIIDPLSLGSYAMEKSSLDIGSYGASSKNFNDILETMLVNFEKMYNLTPKDLLKANFAVVINKLDIPGLDAKIGDPAVERYLAENPKVKNRMDAVNAVCEQFLEEYDAGNFVRILKSRFKNVQYFTCSSTGHNNEGKPYQPVKVEEPILWLLQSVDASLK